MLWFAGFDSKTAAQCTTSEVRKMTIAGSMVMIPPLVGLFSYGYAFYFIFNSIKGAIIGGVVSAIVLLLIDRSIMVYGRPGTFSFGMVGRVLLALTVGFMLAEPIVLKVFEDSITEQQYSEVTAAKKTAAIRFNKKITAVDSLLKEDERRLYKFQKGYTQEMDGYGSKLGEGQGDIYDKKVADYNNYKKEYRNKEVGAKAQIDTIKSQRKKRLEQIESKKDDGLIGRMRALHNLGESEPIVRNTTWLLRIFFILIELLPILIKISPTGDSGLYYKIVDIGDKERETVFAGLSKDREQIIMKEEQIRYAARYAELCEQELTNISNSKGNDAIHLMGRVLSMAEKKMEFKQRAANKITDEVLLNRVYIQIDEIFDGFVSTIDQLNGRSNDNYSSENI